METQAQTKKRCYIHPHRETELACERCRTAYCPDCLVDHEGAKLCPNCIRELEDARAALLTPRQKVAKFGRQLGVIAIVIGVLGVVVVGLFFAYRQNFDRPLTPEELARFRYAMTGSFVTEEGVNVTSTVLGAKIVSATSDDPAHPAKSLINEYTGPGAPAWRTTSAEFPEEVVIGLDQPSSVEKVIFTNNPSEPADTYPKDVEVLLSLQGPDSGFSPAGHFQLEQTTDPQKFTFPIGQALWIKLRVLSNFGSTSYTSLDEFNAFTVPDSPAGGPTPTAGVATPTPGR